MTALTALKEKNTMTTRKLQDDPTPDSEDEDLAELNPAQLVGYRKKRRDGSSHAVAMVHARQLYERGPGLSPAIAEVAAALTGQQRAEVQAAFDREYARLDGIVAESIRVARANAAAQSVLDRLRQAVTEPDDATDTSYLAADRQLTEAVELGVRAGNDYNVALSEAKTKHPELAERIGRGYRDEFVQAPESTFSARDRMVAKIEQLVEDEKITWQLAYERVRTTDRQLFDAVVRERDASR